MSKVIVANESQDVNDVLASIRKLVSEEAQARGEKDDKASEITEPSEDRLVLTTELKVEEEKPLVLNTPTKGSNEPAEIESHPPQAPFQDEVALRALVGEMIREELQGELGNRITRNVRKLIRREIELAIKTDS